MDRVILETRSGRLAGERLVLSPGEAARVGRTERADLIIPDDRHMSAVHFAVQATGMRVVLEDLGSHEGTLRNGEPVTSADLRNGDWIRAGTTDFSVYFEAASRRGDGDGLPLPGDREAVAMDFLSALPHTLYAVLDSARDERIATLLRESVDRRRSLFDGAQGVALERWAPVLVEISRDSDLLESLVTLGWGKRWGIYLTSQRPFTDVRRHLRRFLRVKDDETGERMYFRYYDPWVLRTFLPAATRKHRELFFGEVSSFVLEGESGEVVSLSPGGAEEGA